MPVELIGMFMDYLSKRVGQEVTCKFWEVDSNNNSIVQEHNGILTQVLPFDMIAVGGLPIPFVGTEKAIEEVRHGDSVVYSNPKAIGYRGCYASDHFALVGAQMELLGRSVKLEQLNARYESAKSGELPKIIPGGRKV